MDPKSFSNEPYASSDCDDAMCTHTPADIGTEIAINGLAPVSELSGRRYTN
jgi:hypothetical protein